jgi:hypothetical protein
MKYFKIDRLKAGIEISAEKIILAQIAIKGKPCSVQHLSSVAVMPNVIKPLFKKKNILNEKVFVDCIQKGLKKKIKTKLIGVALPDSCFKVFIKRFKELPGKEQEIKDMVMWSISGSFNIPVEELRISWENMGKDNENYYVFLIVLGMKKVLTQYEQVLKSVGLSSVMLAPVGLNRFNFYAEKVPEIGNNVFLSLFDDSLTAFIFSDGIPVFYKVIKKGLISGQGVSAVEDIDMLLHYFFTKYPDFDIDEFFIASHIKSDIQIKQLLEDINPVDFTIIDESALVNFNKAFKAQSGQALLSLYSSALGTAQSI